MKYLKLGFRDAGFFRSPDTKDYVLDIDGQKKRGTCKRYVSPITSHHISNMLHVLMGERPKASLRKTLIERQEDIFEIANNSYLKIDSFVASNKNGEYYPGESITTKKTVFNSYWKKPSPIYWKRIENLLDSELSTQFIDLLDRLFKCDTLSHYKCADAIDKLTEEFL